MKDSRLHWVLHLKVNFLAWKEARTMELLNGKAKQLHPVWTAKSSNSCFDCHVYKRCQFEPGGAASSSPWLANLCMTAKLEKNSCWRIINLTSLIQLPIRSPFSVIANEWNRSRTQSYCCRSALSMRPWEPSPQMQPTPQWQRLR